MLARVAGFGRWLVFSKTVGAGCLAEAYTTANQLPNILFEVVAGGALAGAVIPVLAGPVARGDRAAQGRIIGALLSWSFLLLAPFALLSWASGVHLHGRDAGPGRDCGGSAATATRMLVIFVPQVFGYAIAVIATAVLQSHKRFAAGALAPLISSLVVIATYFLFAAAAPDADDCARGARPICWPGGPQPESPRWRSLCSCRCCSCGCRSGRRCGWTRASVRCFEGSHWPVWPS